MGRDIRRVPANWQHPKDENGRYIPLLDGSFKDELAKWEEGNKKWQAGLRESWISDEKWIPLVENELNMTYSEWAGNKPEEEDYMPYWSEEEKTHIQLYETTSEGTPKTPVFAADDFEKLCEYAAKYVTTFADYKASKEEWMQMLRNGMVHHKSGNIIFL